MSDLGLNASHEAEVSKFLKFSRSNRSLQVREVKGYFTDMKESRLMSDDHFLKDEVEEMIDSLQTIVCSSVENDLIKDAHSNVLLLVQLFSQAEKWHLKLKADLDVLENSKLLEEIKEFEDNEKSGGTKKPKQLSALSQKAKLEPLNEGGSAALLQIEISRLKEENEALQNKFTQLEKSASFNSKETSRLRNDLEQAQQRVYSERKPQVDAGGDEVALLSDKISSLSGDLRNAEELYQRKCSSMEEEVANSKHYVLALQHEIEVLSEEFDKKFSETTQFKNLKKMLEGKNGQLKELRKRLKNYEPDHEL